jgi:hypothetical protein
LSVESKPILRSASAGPRATPPFGYLLRRWLVIGLGLSGAIIYALRTGFDTTESYFLLHQDLPCLALGVGLVLLLGIVRAPALGRQVVAATSSPRMFAIALAILTVGIGAIGAPLVFGDYVFSLDEFLAKFDAQIFAHGQLMAPVAPAWRPYASALQPMYLLQAPNVSAWSSAYLPIDAMMRGAASWLGLEEALNPVLSGVAVLATYGVGRRLWPDRPRMALAAAALLATSAQLLVMSMSAYAMSAQLAFNMIWLWCFLRGGRLGHAGALAAAFLACGTHQLIFHPLFAAPFVLQLWLDRRWGLAALYTGAYAGFGVFWIEYPSLALWLMGAPPKAAGAFALQRFVSEIVSLLAALKADNIGLMAQALVRFVSWQNPIVPPLAIAGSFAAVRGKGPLRALAVGVMVAIVAMFLIEPSPIHGWGYRYLHGMLGSVCLLAAWTWTRLTDELNREQRQAAIAGFVLACAAALLVLVPIRAWQAWRYVRPYAEADAVVRAAPAEVVIIDRDQDHWFDIGALTRNDPYLRNSPKVMVLGAMNGAQVRDACARFSILVFDGRKAQALGMDLLKASGYLEGSQQRALMAQIRCGRRIP